MAGRIRSVPHAVSPTAQLASGQNKPNRVTIVPAAAAAEFVRCLPLRKLGGLGGKLGAEVEVRACAVLTVNTCYSVLGGAGLASEPRAPREGNRRALPHSRPPAGREVWRGCAVLGAWVLACIRCSAADSGAWLYDACRGLNHSALKPFEVVKVRTRAMYGPNGGGEEGG